MSWNRNTLDGKYTVSTVVRVNFYFANEMLFVSHRINFVPNVKRVYGKTEVKQRMFSVQLFSLFVKREENKMTLFLEVCLVFDKSKMFSNSIWQNSIIFINLVLWLIPVERFTICQAQLSHLQPDLILLILLLVDFVHVVTSMTKVLWQKPLTRIQSHNVLK